MDCYLREKWTGIIQRFLEICIESRLECTEKQWIEINGRKIEVEFIDHDFYLTVQLYCSEVHRNLRSFYDYASCDTKKIISMILWLAFEAEELRVYDIEANDSEEEYNKLRDILVENYRNCYDAFWENNYWKETGEEIFIIRLCEHQIRVHFLLDYRSFKETYIDVSIICFDTGRISSTIINQKEENPRRIIEIIHDMASEQ